MMEQLSTVEAPAYVPAEEPFDPAKLVEDTWNYLGWTVRPLRRLVFIRTHPRPERYGSIILPLSMRREHAELPHKSLNVGTVCAVGPQTKYLKVGDTIAYYRLFFAWWKRFPDQTYIGWIDEDNIFGFYEDGSPTGVSSLD
jgi:hypothetical protein